MPILRSAETFSTLRAACFVSGRDTPCLRCRLGDSSGALGLASWRQCDPAVRPSGDAWRIGIWGSSRPHPRTLGCIRSTNVHAILRNALCFLGPVFLFACGPYPYAPATKCTHHQVARKRHPPTLRVCLSLHLPLSLSLLCRRTVAAVQMTSFNHFKNKRAAHNIHRNQADQWNPFRHVSWGSERRRDTWTASQLEAQDGSTMNGNSGRLAHAATEPTPRSTAVSSNSPNVGTADVPGVQAEKGVDDSDPSLNPASLHPSLADGGPAAGLRNRKTEDEAAMKTDSSPLNPEATPADDNNNGKKKEPKEGIIRHVHPKEPFTVANQLQRTFLNSWINILIIAAPAGIAMKYSHVNGIAVFVVNFIAIIPLAAMLSYATEEVALRTGETLGGLINATFGNAVELIVAIIALADGKVAIVQTSLIGSILSNLLLVMGFCFFFGGLRRQEQHFNHTVAQTAASLLALAAASVIVPSVFEVAAPNVGQDDIAKMSRGTSVILLIVYSAYLFFQLKTHQQVFNEESQKVAAKPWSHAGIGNGAVKQGLAMPSALMGYAMTDQDENQRLSRMLMNQRLLEAEDDEEGEDPQLHFFVALAALTVSTVIIAFCAECMVDSIDEVTKSGGLKEEFVGLILLPIVGNAAEHATAVTVAIKDKMDLAIGVAVGSSMQVALFLIPLMVIIGWGMGNENMDLSFDMFQVAVMFVAVLLTNYLIGDGKSHWLEGFLLICLYSIIAVCSFWYPDSQLDKANGGARG